MGIIVGFIIRIVKVSGRVWFYKEYGKSLVVGFRI